MIEETNARAKAVGKCGDCQMWAKRELGETGFNQGLGKCVNVPVYYDATDVSEDGADGNDRGNVKKEFQGVKAFALDGTGYLAELLVTREFGCVSFVQIVRKT